MFWSLNMAEKFNSEKFFREYDEVVEKTLSELHSSSNIEWVERYDSYILKILGKYPMSEKATNLLNISKSHPFFVYTSISKITNSRTAFIKFDVRYDGQSIVEIDAGELNNNDLNINKYDFKDDKTIKAYPEYAPFKEINDHSEKYRQILKYFADRPIRNINCDTKNVEHKYESEILSQFAKKISKDKPLLKIQPVDLLGFRFQLTTPLKASKIKNGVEFLKYAKKGGGIDILARTGSGIHSTLNIIELKDKAESNEKPEVAIKQAIAYAVFIRELLRFEKDDKGRKVNQKMWYAFFTSNSKNKLNIQKEKVIPENLKINAVIMMPKGMFNEKGFKNYVYTFSGEHNDSIRLHYIYFNENDFNEEYDTSLN